MKQSISPLFTGLFADPPIAAVAVYLFSVPSFCHEMSDALAPFFMGTALA